ncbi:hypothetical protein B0H67DRAFT_591042 [Lasiosphaeris hirsuta]|uniref:Oxidoreductase n=1 Tax=Lasiosphaeris hirsuta TaxID=260670 RepID=A0AA39ZVI7_9PEZI|nr:hypothetical protein B0H67DRAFT_591042 [Lasiosphaeris hirsuta]
MFGFGRGVSFTADDIPSLKGKVILVTGGNSGLGRQSVLDLAKHEPTLIWLAARGLARAQAAIDGILKEAPGATIKPLDLDLASFESTKCAARRVLDESDRLDILMLNAGIMMTPPGLTKEGYETQFGTNHVGHALLTKLLLPLLLKTAEAPGSDVRVVSLSSMGYQLAPGKTIRFETLKTPAEGIMSMTRYGQSKLANILFATEMARRYPQIKTVAIHPGVVASNLANTFSQSNVLLGPFTWVFQTLVATPVAKGVRNQLWASVADGVKSGQYYTPIGNDGQMDASARSEELAGKLWEWTEKELEGQTI